MSSSNKIHPQELLLEGIAKYHTEKHILLSQPSLIEQHTPGTPYQLNLGIIQINYLTKSITQWLLDKHVTMGNVLP